MPDTTEDMVEDRISCFVTSAYIVESDEDVFKIGTLFESFFFLPSQGSVGKIFKKRKQKEGFAV